MKTESDTPRTDDHICGRRWTERQGQFERVECELLYIEPDFARELERELAVAITDLDSGFMDGAYARLKSLQEKERELARVTAEKEQNRILLDRAQIEAHKLAEDLAIVTAERDALRPAARLGLTVLREARDVGAIYGGWLQEIAEKYGLLHSVTMTSPCGENCRCAEYGDEWPTECLRMTPETLALEKEFGDE